MKKKEIYILISIILIAVLGIIGLNIVKNKKQPTKKDESTAETTPTPSTEPNTDTDSLEVKDKKWHVREVDCPNQLCVKMGWADENSIIPITCLPNDVFIGSANLLSEYIGVK